MIAMFPCESNFILLQNRQSHKSRPVYNTLVHTSERKLKQDDVALYWSILFLKLFSLRHSESSSENKVVVTQHEGLSLVASTYVKMPVMIVCTYNASNGYIEMSDPWVSLASQQSLFDEL